MHVRVVKDVGRVQTVAAPPVKPLSPRLHARPAIRAVAPMVALRTLGEFVKIAAPAGLAIAIPTLLVVVAVVAVVLRVVPQVEVAGEAVAEGVSRTVVIPGVIVPVPAIPETAVRLVREQNAILRGDRP